MPGLKGADGQVKTFTTSLAQTLTALGHISPPLPDVLQPVPSNFAIGDKRDAAYGRAVANCRFTATYQINAGGDQSDIKQLLLMFYKFLFGDIAERVDLLRIEFGGMADLHVSLKRGGGTAKTGLPPFQSSIGIFLRLGQFLAGAIAQGNLNHRAGNQ